MAKFPSFSQWKQIFKVLKRGEKITLFALCVVAIASFVFLTINFYYTNTVIVPALGSTYVEGIVGQPRFINPIYGETNDVDRTLIDLVFSGLTTYDNQGTIINDLAKNYTVSPDGKTYEFTLKNALWHDGKPLTADDIVFTIKTIQNSDYKSPLRANWIGVEVGKISDSGVRFTLKSPYNSFLENATVKILPKHIFENVLAENFAISSYNLQPMGSGPFQFLNIDQASTGFISQLDLTSNRRYYEPASHIENISFKFFEKKEDLVKAANSGQVNGFSLTALDNNQVQATKSISQGWFNNTRFSIYSFSLPRYVAVFFNNEKSSLFSDATLRQAMSHAINKEDLVQIINNQTKGNITPVDSPILPNFYGFAGIKNPYGFNIDQAAALLDKAGFKKNTDGRREKLTTKKPAFQFKSYLKIGSKGTEVIQLQQCLAKLDEAFKTALESETTGTFGKGTDIAVTAFQKKYLADLKPTGETGASTRAKLNELCAPPSSNTQALKFTLTTINQPQLVAVANLIKTYWQNIGAEVEINALSATDIKAIIKNRGYEALLYGEALGAEPDLYPFWHSSQKIDPGLNLSAYENKKADQLLKESRETIDKSVKQQKYEQLQSIIANDIPALFLYNPDYVYWVSDAVRGIDTAKIIDPAKRFSNITNWYLKTKRTWK